MGLASDIKRQAVDLIWAQWGALGVPAAIGKSQLLIDPEALLVETARRTGGDGGDVRVRDGAISWCVSYSDLVTTTRLRRMVDALEDGAAHEVRVLCRQVADRVGRLSWPMVDPGEAPSWNPSTAVKLPALTLRPGLLRVRMRALFGANARAEVVAFLACASTSVDRAVIARATGYSRKQVGESLEGLEMAGWLQRIELGTSSRYALAPVAREDVGVPLGRIRIAPGQGGELPQSTGSVWLEWPQRYELVHHLEGAARMLEEGDIFMALAGIRMLDRAFSEQGIAVPNPMDVDEDEPRLELRLRDWLAGTSTRLTGGAPML